MYAIRSTKQMDLPNVAGLCETTYPEKGNKFGRGSRYNTTILQEKQRKDCIKLSGDGDVLALLNEYPQTYMSGKRKRETAMYLAVDLKEVMLEWLQFLL